MGRLALCSLLGFACFACAQQPQQQQIPGDVYESGANAGTSAQAVQKLYDLAAKMTVTPSSGYDAQNGNWPEADAAWQQWDNAPTNGNAALQKQRTQLAACADQLNTAILDAERSYRIQISQKGNSAAQEDAQKLLGTARKEFEQCDLAAALNGSNGNPATGEPGPESQPNPPIQGGVSTGPDDTPEATNGGGPETPPTTGTPPATNGGGPETPPETGTPSGTPGSPSPEPSSGSPSPGPSSGSPSPTPSSGSPSTPAPGPCKKQPGTATGDDLVTALYKFYRSQQFTKWGAAYMVGSLMWESQGLNPDINEIGGGPGYGLGQWTNKGGFKSYTALQCYAQAHGKPISDFSLQAHFTVQQRTNITDLFKNAQNAQQAQDDVTQFENYGEVGASRWQYGAAICKNVVCSKAPPNRFSDDPKVGVPAGTGLGGNVSKALGSGADLSNLIQDLQCTWTEPPNLKAFMKKCVK